MKTLSLPIAMMFVFATSNAQNVTWSEDVACVVYTHCTRCHNNTNSIAAIPLTNYNEAWSQRNAIKYYVENKLMPPFSPKTENSRYTHEKTLTQHEIDLIVSWVNQGTMQGDTALTPATPIIKPLTSQIASPDFSNRIPAYSVPNLVAFQYHCFVLPTTYPTAKKISEIEILPTDLSAIYSAFLYSDTSSVPLALDAADASNGYENYAGIGSPTAKLIYGWVNGNPKYHTPLSMAILLEANAHLVLRILFAEDAHNKTDSTLVNMKFDSTAIRFVDVATLLHHNTNLQNPPFIIPADSVKTFYEQYTVPSDISLLSVSHWAQKFCSSMNCYAVSPTNDTIHILEIEDHEELWSQGVYYFDKPKKIPAGSLLFGEAEYDNTSLNPNNPFFPTHTIVAGTSDTSEQMLFSFSYLSYQTGDENIIADTVLHQLHYLNCKPAHTVGINSIDASKVDWEIFPNPTSSTLTILSKTEFNEAELKVVNILGETVLSKQISSKNNATLDVAKLNNGIYFIKIKSNTTLLTKKIIKQ